MSCKGIKCDSIIFQGGNAFGQRDIIIACMLTHRLHARHTAFLHQPFAELARRDIELLPGIIRHFRLYQLSDQPRSRIAAREIVMQHEAIALPNCVDIVGVNIRQDLLELER